MFTGIVTHLGKISQKVQANSDSLAGSLIIEAPADLCQQLNNGMSVAVDGICFTVAAQPDDQHFSVDFMPETAKKTNVGTMQIGDLVNLELPATPTTFLAGHVVQGHVDGIGIIKEIKNDENSRLVTFSIDSSLAKYIVSKGSIAVNGISLTVIEVTSEQASSVTLNAVLAEFSVGIIPHTWDQTMLHTAKVGDQVNIEVDVLAKYLEKLQKG